MKDPLGDRMKNGYEKRAALMLPRRTYTLIRIDGKAFHTYTRGLDKPYDKQFLRDMQLTTKFLCERVQGCKFGYVQSDEISLLLTDFATPQTNAWFDGNQQKIVSISASMATAFFNFMREKEVPEQLACFDSRAWTIPDVVEVENYFIWRQQDATRNSITLLASAYFSDKQLHGKSTNERQEMLWQEHNVNWNDEDACFKRGTVCVPRVRWGEHTYFDNRTQKDVTVSVERSVWELEAPPVFTSDDGRAFLGDVIPIPT